MSDEKFTKILINQISAAKEMMDWGVAGGHTTPEQLRLTIEARKEKAKELIDSGLSQREAAKVLGVGQATIGRDLANQDGSDSEPERFTDPLEQSKKREDKLREQLKIAQTHVLVPDRQYGAVVIDPPWPMKKIEREVAPNQVEFDYPTMDYEQLRAWGRQYVLPILAPDCHFWMWTTQKFLPMALRLFDDYGIKYVLTMVWHKPGGFQPFGLPQYNCEFVLYGRMGAPKFIDTKAFNCCFNAPRAEHSRKPDEFYDLIRRVTDEPRIDIFSREPRNGFDQFGNETEKFAGAA